jgi:hypothetical protein
MKHAAIAAGLTAIVAAGFGSAIVAPGDSAAPIPTRLHSKKPDERDTVTHVAMRQVNFWIIPDAALRIRTMRGTMRPLSGSGPVVFDDKNSFVIHLDYAEIGLSGQDISNLMNEYIFHYPGAPLKKLKVRTAGNRVVQTGVMHKILDIPFEITAELSMTPDGLIRMHPVRTRILGVDGNALMKAFGLSLQKILDLSKAKGVTVKGNDLFLDPVKILPPPAIEGRATAIRIDRDQLVQTFGTLADGKPLTPPDTSAPGYMYYQGGTLHFGKLLMLDSDMEIVDLRPTGFFDFDLDKYDQQLVAGYSRTLADKGLLVYMLGLDKLRSGGATVAELPH